MVVVAVPWAECSVLWSSFLAQDQLSVVPGCLTIIVTLGQASCLGPQSDQNMALLLTSRHPVASQVTGPQGVPDGNHGSGSVRQPVGERARSEAGS